MRGWRFALIFLLVVATLSLGTWWLVRPIAPQFTGNMSFDQKMMFVRDLPDEALADVTLVAGSSMALNNVDTDMLDRVLGRRFQNIGVWGMSISDTHRLTNNFLDTVKVREVILTTQFFEVKDSAPSHFSLPLSTFQDYLETDTDFGGIAYRDFYRSLRSRQKWYKQSGNPRSYTSLVFSKTGAVALDISGASIDPSRWNPAQTFSADCQDCMDAVQAMCVAMSTRDVSFSVVMPPLSNWVLANRADVKSAYLNRKARLKVAVPQCGARFFDASEWASFDDSCFADFSHLNAEGAAKFSALYLDWRADGRVFPHQSIRCAS